MRTLSHSVPAGLQENLHGSAAGQNCHSVPKDAGLSGEHMATLDAEHSDDNGLTQLQEDASCAGRALLAIDTTLHHYSGTFHVHSARCMLHLASQ